MADHNGPTCPFCPFSDGDANFVAEHIHFCHPEGGATSVPGDSRPLESIDPAASSFSPGEASTDQYVDCPLGCGESVTAAELPTHLDLHVAEDMAWDDGGINSTPVNPEAVPSDHDHSSYQDDLFDVPVSRRRGKRDADRYFERTNSSKPGRARSPPRTMGPDGAKRLGVRFSTLGVLLNMLLTSNFSARNWDPMLMKRRCLRGCTNCWRRAAEPQSRLDLPRTGDWQDTRS